MFTRILAATDRVTVPDATVLTALQLSVREKAALHIVHVLESSSTQNRDIVRHYRSGRDMPANADYKETIKKKILKTYDEWLDDGDIASTTVTTGFPWHEIKRCSRKISADLIVMGPHSTRAQRKRVVRIAGKIGSSVEEVIKREKCPVMVVNRPISVDRADFKSVLVCVDFSKSCECAFLFAEQLARSYAAKLSVFHMIPMPPDSGYSQTDYQADLDAGTNRLQKNYPGTETETVLEYRIWGGALPHAEILKCAGQVDADLVVMGSHTKEQKGKWYAGSAVERVAYRSECPVIVLTDPAVLHPWEDDIKPEDMNNSGMDRTIHVRTRHSEKP